MSDLPENPNFTLKSNRLIVERQPLWVDVLEASGGDKLAMSAEQLERCLKLGRRVILEGIETIHDRTKKRTPSAVRPSIFVAQVGSTAQTGGKNSQVLTERGLANGTGILTSQDELQEQFHGHWNTVEATGFLPEVRRTTGDQDSDGAWLLLRKPSIDDVLHRWLAYEESLGGRAIKEELSEVPATEQQGDRIIAYRIAGEQAIEDNVDRGDIAKRARQQVGLLIAVAALRLTIDDQPGYNDDIEGALTYASNTKHIDDSVVLAIENATY